MTEPPFCEQALVIVLAKELVLEYCNYCLTKTQALKRCSACRMMAYCSPQCQKNDWRQHRPECKAIVARRFVADDGIRLVMRLVQLYEANIITPATDQEGPSGTRTFYDLEDGGDRLNSSAEAFLDTFKKFAIAPFSTDDVVKHMYKKVAMNSVSASNPFGSHIGIALCIKLTAARHSCKPATRVAFRNRLVMLVPTSKCPMNVESACHSYIDELQPVNTRKKILKEKYGFDCDCEGCLDNERNDRMEAFCCGNCTNGWIKNAENATCSTCDWKMTPEHFQMCQIAENSAIQGEPILMQDDVPMNKRIDMGEKLLFMANNTLHRYNVLRLPIYRLLFGASVVTKNIPLARKYGLAMLELQLQYQNENDLAILYHKLRLAQIMIAGNAIDIAKQLLESIYKPYVEIFGMESLATNNIKLMLNGINQSATSSIPSPPSL
ncbi:unnamed protein product [Caenorhabditis bovis]|uniref:MYND-type domain-containing protein n=1 Tax=Caenorhabditis bovis TaxID=2654633 RepID=A0A8S1ELF4_9PELO|nr:unnamed protein product [Caenorhabditis bovis]